MLLAIVVNAVAISTSNAHPLLLNSSPFNFYAPSPAPKDTTTKKKPRYPVRKTTTETQEDAQPKAIDLRDPDNLQTEVSYNEKDNTYSVGTTLKGGTAKDSKKNTAGNAGKSGNAGNSNKSGTSGKSSSNKNQSRNATNVTSTGTASGLGYTASTQTQLGLATSYLSAPLLMTPEE